MCEKEDMKKHLKETRDLPENNQKLNHGHRHRLLFSINGIKTYLV